MRDDDAGDTGRQGPIANIPLLALWVMIGVDTVAILLYGDNPWKALASLPLATLLVLAHTLPPQRV